MSLSFGSYMNSFQKTFLVTVTSIRLAFAHVKKIQNIIMNTFVII